MDLGTLQVNLETNLKQFSSEMKKSVDMVEKSSKEIQNSIADEVKTSNELRDRFFKATHNNLENDLYEHDRYFSDLRSKWSDNESMLTQINITANAEREKILKDYEKSATNMMSKLKTLFRMGFLIYMINSLADTVTAYAKARLEGENYFNAILKSLPIINRMTKAFEDMGEALGDLYTKGQVAASAAMVKYQKNYNDMIREMNQSIELLRAGDKSAMTEIEQFYNNRKADIKAMKDETGELIKYNARLQKQIDELEAQKKQPMGRTVNVESITGIMPVSVGRTKTDEQIDKEIAALKDKQEVYVTTAQKSNMLLAAETERNLKIEALAEKTKNEVTNATIRMYQDMGQYPQEYFDLQEELLDKQVKAYKDAGGDIFLAEQWKASEMTRIYKEAAGEWKSMWKDVAESINSSMKTAWADIMMDARNASDYLRNMLNQIERAFHEAMYQQFIEPSVTKFIGGLGEIGGAGASGTVGLAESGIGTSTMSPGATHMPGLQYGGIIPKPLFAAVGRLVPKGTDTVHAMVSPGELIIPEKITSYLAKAFGNPAGLSAPSQNININVSAIDAAGTYRFLNTNKRSIASMLNTTRSENHPFRRK
jgi:hypothetical protein